MNSRTAAFCALLLLSALPLLSRAGTDETAMEASLRAAVEADASPEQLAWLRYQDERYALLARSERPRDRALATLSLLTKAWPPRSMVIMDAAAAAPDDLLVQWIYATNRLSSEQSCSRSSPDPRQGARLAQLEPDNAAAHMPQLEQAYADKDEFAVDAALAAMAAASRFDSHYLDIVEAGEDLIDRYPLPEALLQDPDRQGRPFSDEELRLARYTLATTQAATMTPVYQPLSRACDAQQNAAAGARRFAACGDIGRLMVRAPTLLERLLGYALLRRSGQISPEETAVAARQRWLQQQLGPAMFQNEDDLEPPLAFQRVFRETRDETAAAEYVITHYPPPPGASAEE